MTCTLLIPPEGLMELWNFDRKAIDVLKEKDLEVGSMQVNIVIDGHPSGTAAFNITQDLAPNRRANATLRYLIGAHFEISGPLVVDGLDERAAIEIMQEVAK